MKNKLISLLTALCMTLVLFTGVQISVSAEGTDCTGTHGDDWTAISDASGFSNLENGKHYYLTDNVTLGNAADGDAQSNQTAIEINGVDVTLCLNGHTISIQNGVQARIFYIKGNGSLTLCDCSSGKTGTLTGGNVNGNGGAVYVYSGSFTMYGGTISGNTASGNGGGVYSSGTFTMNGGTISGNTASSNGGGVRNTGTFTINGKVDISGNKVGNSADNVNLSTDKTITIDSGFDDTSKIGVNTTATPDCKDNFVDVTGTASDISKSFTADISGQSIVYNDGKVQLKGAHTYVDGVCTVCGEPETNTGDDDNKNDGITCTPNGSTLTISGTGEIGKTDLDKVADKESITYVVIDSGITSVGDGAFDGFTNLETVTVPDSVESIGDNAFDGTKLNIVYYESGAAAAGDFPASATKIEYSVNGDGKIVIESITLGSGVSEVGKVEIPNSIGGMNVVEIAAEVRDKVSVEGHTAHNYENGSCTICGAADPNAGSGSQGTTPSHPSNPSAPSRPTTPSNPVVTPNVTTATETTAKADEEIISDDTYTGEDISSGAGDNSDDGGIADMTVEVIALAVAAAVVCAVLIKKLIF